MPLPTYDPSKREEYKKMTRLWGTERWKYEDMLKCTDNLSQDRFVAEIFSGTDFHCAKVYRGSVGDKHFAVKIWDEDIDEGRAILLDELAVLSKGGHKGSVKPIGFCTVFYEDNVLPNAAIYALDPMDSLRNLIPKATFTWSARIKVVFGIAVTVSGFHPKYKLRNVDAHNFLCDKNYIPRLYDIGSIAGGVFGYRCCRDKVMGGRGYADYHAVDTGKCSGKIDVFAYGLLLLSLITGRLVDAATETDREFVKWAEGEYRGRKASGRKRPSLVNKSYESSTYFNSDDGAAVTKLALTCIRYKPDERPDMDQVVRELNSLKIITDYGEEIGVKDMLEDFDSS